jgi:UDPglucose--hexose-1-phosphate uridylyltransferase
MEKVPSRSIIENGECIVFAPYYSVEPFEVWILPKKHVNFHRDCDEKLLFALANILRYVLKSYAKTLVKCLSIICFTSPSKILNIT